MLHWAIPARAKGSFFNLRVCLLKLGTVKQEGSGIEEATGKSLGRATSAVQERYEEKKWDKANLLSAHWRVREKGVLRGLAGDELPLPIDPLDASLVGTTRAVIPSLFGTIFMQWKTKPKRWNNLSKVIQTINHRLRIKTHVYHTPKKHYVHFGRTVNSSVDKSGNKVY